MSEKILVKALVPCRSDKVSYPVGAKFKMTLDHAKQAEKSRVVEIVEAKEGIADFNARDGVKAIKACSDLETLNNWFQQENAAEEPRKTIVEALEKRIEGLG